MTFNELLQKQIECNKPEWIAPPILLAIDPGETTGVALFHYGQYMMATFLHLGPSPGLSILEEFIDKTVPHVIVCEEYRIYGGLRAPHKGSNVPTLRIIGALEYMCERKEIKLYKQMASAHKGFCTDDKLKVWGFYKGINPHARDATRVGCYWLLFNKDYGR
jgi:hypothetical protein